MSLIVSQDLSWARKISATSSAFTPWKWRRRPPGRYAGLRWGSPGACRTFGSGGATAPSSKEAGAWRGAAVYPGGGGTAHASRSAHQYRGLAGERRWRRHTVVMPGSYGHSRAHGSQRRWLEPRVQAVTGHWRRDEADGAIRSEGWWEAVTVTWSRPAAAGHLRRCGSARWRLRWTRSFPRLPSSWPRVPGTCWNTSAARG